jgi:hypothetical protein
VALASTAQAEPSPGGEYRLDHTTWSESVVRGVSGLTASSDGTRFLAAAERQRVILPFSVTAQGVSGGAGLALEGVPDELDVESIAGLPNDRLALGTEARSDHSTDAILIAKLEKDRVTVVEKLSFSYEPFGLRAEGNRGVEGLCFTDGRLLAAAEQVIAKQARFAPIGSYDFSEKRWAAYRLRLTSAEGKISALACRTTSSHREVFAIERHYGTMRVVRFTLPLLDTGGELSAEVVVDLAKLFPGNPPNFEGLEILPDHRLLLISDNDHGGTDGPTHLVIVEPMPKRDDRIKPGAFVE